MTQLKILVLSIIITGVVVVPVLAKHHGGEGFGREGKRTGHMAKLTTALNLTAEQATEIEKIVSERKEDTELFREKEQAIRAEIHDMLEKDALDESRLRELVREKATLKTEMMIARHTSRNEIDQILTPEQQQKHADLRQQRMAQKGQKKEERCKGM